MACHVNSEPVRLVVDVYFELVSVVRASVLSLILTINVYLICSRIALRKVFNSPDGTDNVGELPVSTRIEFANPKSGRPVR